MKINRSVLITALILINIVLDQVSKIIVRLNVEPGSISPIIGNYFTLHNVENTGAFLGMGSNFNPTVRLLLLLILPVIVLAYALYMVYSNKKLDTYTTIGLAFIIGGGASNLIDRFIYGSVTDFLHIDLGGVFRTGIFNVADMSVMFGFGMLLLGNFLKKKGVKEPQ